MLQGWGTLQRQAQEEEAAAPGQGACQAKEDHTGAAPGYRLSTTTPETATATATATPLLGAPARQPTVLGAAVAPAMFISYMTRWRWRRAHARRPTIRPAGAEEDMGMDADVRNAGCRCRMNGGAVHAAPCMCQGARPAITCARCRVGSPNFGGTCGAPYIGVGAAAPTVVRCVFCCNKEQRLRRSISHRGHSTTPCKQLPPPSPAIHTHTHTHIDDVKASFPSRPLAPTPHLRSAP